MTQARRGDFEIDAGGTPSDPLSSGDRAVLFLDLVGYVRHMARDEMGTIELVSRCFETLRVLVRRHEGGLVKTTGDGAMLLFREPDEALALAAEFHRQVARLQDGRAEPALFRAGVHFGEVRMIDGDAYGQSVNLAARIQAEAEPGTTAVSAEVVERLPPPALERLAALGPRRLKNVESPVPLWRATPGVPSALSAVGSAAVRIALLDGVRVEAGDAPVRLRGAYAPALLGVLALTPGRAEARDRLAVLLWSDATPGAARRALAERMEALRRALPAPGRGVLFDVGGQVGLDPLRVDTDLARIERELEAGRIDPVLADPHWHARILSGLDGLNGVLDAWLKVTREAWRTHLRRRLEAAVARAGEGAGDAEVAAAALLSQEPGNEIASAAVIEARIAAGDRAGALAEHERLARHLAVHYGEAPGERVMAAVEAARGERRPAAPPRRRLLRLGVVVEDVPPNAAGFADTLLENLSKFRDWSVLESPADEADRRLGGVDYRLRLSRGAPVPGGGPRLALRLHDEDGRMVWRESLTPEDAADPRRQRDTVGRIAAKLEVYISTDRIQRVLGDREVDGTCHDRWLRGQQAFMRWTPEGAVEARRTFERLVAEAPAFAPAHASLASLSNVRHIIWPGQRRGPGEVEAADRLASRAVELDPLDARNHRVVAWAAALNGAFDRASLHLDLAVELNDCSPDTLGSCAMGFAWLGERVKSVALLTRLRQIAPEMPAWLWAYVAAAGFFVEPPEMALRAAERAGDSIVDTEFWRAALLARLGRPEAAEALDRLTTTVSRVWVGSEPPDVASVSRFFVEAYPIGRASDRALLSESIERALGPRASTRASS